MRRKLPWLTLCALLALLGAAGAARAVEDPQAFPVPPPPFSEGIFPCSDCHEGQETNPRRRELVDEHTDIRLRHASFMWCLDCHDAGDRDRLRLRNLEKVGFEVSYLLCAQCHGPQFRRWEIGLHGKRTGFWNGRKEYLLCAHCHNPHDPPFKPLKPEPAPVYPSRWSYGGRP